MTTIDNGTIPSVEEGDNPHYYLFYFRFSSMLISFFPCVFMFLIQIVYFDFTHPGILYIVIMICSLFDSIILCLDFVQVSEVYCLYVLHTVLAQLHDRALACRDTMQPENLACQTQDTLDEIQLDLPPSKHGGAPIRDIVSYPHPFFSTYPCYSLFYSYMP